MTPARGFGLRGRLLLIASAALALGVAVFLLGSASVAVVIDDDVLTTRAFGGDVAAVLARLDVEVKDADRVEPGVATAVQDGLRVVVTRAKTIEIAIDERAPQALTAVVDTVADVLREAGLEDVLEREARIEPAPDTLVADGDRIDVDLPIAVSITVDDREHRLETYAATVAAALEDAEVEVGDDDVVEPPGDHALEKATAIAVRRVAIVEDVIEVPIEHDEERQDTASMPSGETDVTTEGEDGIRRETYTVTLVDGKEAERTLVAQEVVREPIDRVVLVGTGPSLVEQAQSLLASLGYPVGTVDGVDGPQTRRGLCAWRRLEGHDVSRGPLLPSELDALRATSGLPSATSGRGAMVDRTCQVVYYRQDGRWQQVHAASTGTDGLPQPGDYNIQRTREGWHTSTLYPSPTPNMYNTLYIRGAVAIHGSNNVPTYPASKGCVRVTPASADQLFANLGVGDPIAVIGSY